jgi:hypothetical protein
MYKCANVVLGKTDALFLFWWYYGVYKQGVKKMVTASTGVVHIARSKKVATNKCPDASACRDTGVLVISRADALVFLPCQHTISSSSSHRNAYYFKNSWFHSNFLTGILCSLL